MPSLAQLNDAVMAFIEDHPDALITVVVDATFGHRIDSSEVREFDAAVSNNELVAPPAGAIGRGDAFLLSIANKVGATVLSNDSFQEFHGTYTWLFDEGRLIGGKPVPHIGWVFVPRVPVRGPISRTAVKEAKRKKATTIPSSSDAAATASAPSGRRSKRQTSPEASRPMPVPKAPPPHATLRGAQPSSPAPVSPKVAAASTSSGSGAAASGAGSGGKSGDKASTVNDLLPFLSFVEHHPIGTVVHATVESYSSHGAYVRLVGDVVGYVPLRMMASPAPRSAREFMTIGDEIMLVVESFAPTRRSIDLATVAMATAKPPVPRKATGRRKKAAASDAVVADVADIVAEAVAAAADAGAVGGPSTPGAAPAATSAEAPKPAKRARKRQAAAVPDVTVADVPESAEAPASEPVAAESEPTAAPARTPRKRAAKKAVADTAASAAESVAVDAASDAAPAAEQASATAEPTARPAKRRGAKKAATPDATPAPEPAPVVADAAAAGGAADADAPKPARTSRRRRSPG